MSYVWYVEPLNDVTNEYISRELPPEDALRDQACEDGKRHNLWRCQYWFVALLNRSQQSLRFAAWVQEGNGQIRRWALRRKTFRLKRASGMTKSQ